jgi:flagellum-specific ATP synthase
VPAVDVLPSLSRLQPRLLARDDHRLSLKVRETLAHLREGRDLVEIGAYRRGTNPDLDRALALRPALDAFLRQDVHETTTLEETWSLLRLVFGR